MTATPPSGSGDDVTPSSEAEVEAVLTHRAGQQVPPHLEQDVRAVMRLRESLVVAAPPPNAELAQLLREGSPRRPRSPRLVHAAGWFVGLGMGAQVGLASAAAAAGLVAAGAAHVLPAPVQDAYDSFVASLQPEDEDQGRDVPSQVGSGTGVATGTSTTDLVPGAPLPGIEPDRTDVDARDDGEVERNTPDPHRSGSGPAGHGAGALPAGGPPVPGPNAAGGPGVGSPGHGNAHSAQGDDEDAAEDAAGDAEDEAEDAADDAEDEAEDAADDAEDEAEDAADEAEDKAEDGAEGGEENGE